MLLLSAIALAGTVSTTFDLDGGGLIGGELADGALWLQDEEARLDLGALSSLRGELVLVVDSGRFTLAAGEAAWVADYAPGGAITLGEGLLPFPHGQRRWVVREEPLLDLGDDAWEAGGTLHADLLLQDGLWYLYWTGIMSPGYSYRQIGVATSTDTRTWSRHAGNPVLTIDYGPGIDGVHNHMPSVVVEPDGRFSMAVSCYQNNVGNRICGAESEDGLSWSRLGVWLDLGAPGDFDQDSLRCPELWRDEAGDWHMLYYGTQGSEHYGPTAYATSRDGRRWTKEGAFTLKSDRLECPGVLSGPYGLEGWHNCEDALCYVHSDGDWTSWELDPTPEIVKNWAPWSSGYVQAPSVVLDGGTYRMVFNAFSYDTGYERLAWAETEPVPGGELRLALDWDGARLRVAMNEGPALETALARLDELRVLAEGQARLLSLDLEFEEAPGDGGGDGGGGDGGGADGGGADGGAADGGGAGGTDGGGAADGGAAGDGGAPDDEQGKGGCGCQGAPVAQPWLRPLWLLPLLALGRRRRIG